MIKKLTRALCLVHVAAPKMVVATIFLAFAQSLLPLASLYSLKLAIDLLTRARGIPSNGNYFSLAWLIGLSGAFYLLHLAAKLSGMYVGEALSLQVTEKTQRMIAEKATQVDLAYYEDPTYFDTLHLAQQEAPHRLGRLVGAFGQILQSAFSFVAIGGLLFFSMHWSVALIAAAITVPAVLLRIRNARQLYGWQRRQTATERQVAYYEWLLCSAGLAKESRLFNLGQLFIQRASDLRQKLRLERLHFSRKRLAGDGLSQSAAAIAATGIVGYMAFHALRGALTVGDVVMNYQAFQRGIAALQDLAGGISTIHESNLFVGRLFQFLDLPEPPIRTAASPAFPTPMRHGIEFHDVTFAYRGSTTNVLNGVSFHIEPGQMIALVGGNGAGKSTLVKLLCGLYSPIGGRITVDHIDLREFDRRVLWDAFTVLFQDYGQYFVSAEENISFGDITHAANRDRVMGAAGRSGADEVIDALPNGYAQQLGTLFEGGQELSIGQWQKIALARTFFREAPLIILDEPSSALDVRAEHDVFQQFKTLTAGRTSVVISHRLSTVRMADRILVLDNGQLTEVGSHDELMTTGGVYAELFETQASSYR